MEGRLLETLSWQVGGCWTNKDIWDWEQKTCGITREFLDWLAKTTVLSPVLLKSDRLSMQDVFPMKKMKAKWFHFYLRMIWQWKDWSLSLVLVPSPIGESIIQTSSREDTEISAWGHNENHCRDETEAPGSFGHLLNIIPEMILLAFSLLDSFLDVMGQ